MAFERYRPSELAWNLDISPVERLERFFSRPYAFYFDREFRYLSAVLLANNLNEWSKNPRLYFVLRESGYLDLLTYFVSQGYQDNALPLQRAELEALLSRALVENVSLSVVGATIGRHQSRATPQAPAIYQSALDAYFDVGRPETKALEETDFEAIGRLLEHCGQGDVAETPKLYYLLRLIEEEHCIRTFLSHNYTDVWFPFRKYDIPRDCFANEASKKKFLTLQELVCNRSWSENTHMNFMEEPDVLEFRKILGKGVSGDVDHVYCRSHNRNYARKSVYRVRDSVMLRSFANEVKVLKSISHRHCTAFAASYTDDSTVAMLTMPVAEINLDKMMHTQPVPTDRRNFLQTSFGCLAVTILYLHEKGILHKDLKPQNILVNSNQLLITDFGLSANIGHTQTSSTLGRTPLYDAPEIESGERHSKATDIWALGCVFLEILAALCGFTPKSIRTYFQTHGSTKMYYQNNQEAIKEFLLELKTDEIGERQRMTNIAESLVRSMLTNKSRDRPIAEQLVLALAEGFESSALFGQCCSKEMLAAAKNYSGMRGTFSMSQHSKRNSQGGHRPEQGLQTLRKKLHEHVFHIKCVTFLIPGEPVEPTDAEFKINVYLGSKFIEGRTKKFCFPEIYEYTSGQVDDPASFAVRTDATVHVSWTPEGPCFLRRAWDVTLRLFSNLALSTNGILYQRKIPESHIETALYDDRPRRGKLSYKEFEILYCID